MFLLKPNHTCYIGGFIELHFSIGINGVTMITSSPTSDVIC